MSGGGGEKDSETTVEPWGAQAPYLQQMFKEAHNLFGKGPIPVYPGQMTSGFTPTEQQAQQMGIGAALGPQTAMAQGSANAQQFLTNPAILNPASNPYLAQSAQAAIRPIYEQYAERVLPNIRGESIGAGTYGSNRQGIAEGLAAGRTAQAAGDVTSNIYSQAYGQGLGAMERGIALGPTAQGMQLAPASTMAGIGAQQRAYEQALIDEQIQRYNYTRSAPYTNLAQFQNFVQGGYGGQTSAQQGGAGGGGAMGAIGGGLAGAGTGAMIGSIFPGPGTAIGAGVGGTIGLLSGYYG